MAKCLFLNIILLIALLAPGCKDFGTIPEPPQVVYLSGTIDNWQATPYNTIYFYSAGNFQDAVLDSSTVGPHGDFATVLSSLTPPPQTFSQFRNREDSSQYYLVHDTRTLSNPSARYSLLCIYVPNPSVGIYDQVWCGNSSTLIDSLVRVADFHVQYFYFAQPTTITGQVTITYFNPTLFDDVFRANFVTDYDVNASAGWNRVVTTIVSDDGQTRHYKVTAISSTDGMTWFVTTFIPTAFEETLKLL